jgi:bis(5'-nucleosyl)-tetraphosphatase (symmetrical)
MATYAIGDVQGCYDELRKLLRAVNFVERRDRLWFVGDLVNRGPKSLEVLRFVRDLGRRAVVVLGNHDLHLICHFEGVEKRRERDTLDKVLAARDARELVDWLRTRQLVHVDERYAMVHAGLLPQWSTAKAAALAKEVEAALAARDYLEFLRNMYGSRPATWKDSLAGWDRLRVLINAMTRMRFCTRKGRMEFHTKGATPPQGYLAWFEARRKEKRTVVFGHWSALGLRLGKGYAALDSGCVWGGALTALRLEDGTLHQVACRSYQARGEE